MKFKAVAGLTVGLMMIGSAAIAHAPTVTITAPTNNALVEVAAFPATVAVSGSVAHTNITNNGQHNLCSINEFAVSATDGTTTWPLGSKTWSWANDIANCPASENWSYDFVVPEPGVYTITAKGKHSSDWGEHEIDFEIDLELIVTYPAAPSVAGKLLKDGCVAARYGSGKTGGNYIADVAAVMAETKGTDFMDVAKSSTVAYKAAVRSYLESRELDLTGANCPVE